jgi:hypothetical protein
MSLPSMSPDAVENVRRFEVALGRYPLARLHTEHSFHAGIYTRTIKLPAGVALAGVTIKVPTVLIISGDVLTYGDNGTTRITGYHVTLGQPGRKQAFVALTDTWMTMMFATDAQDVETAERQFTDEYENLGSRREQ